MKVNFSVMNDKESVKNVELFLKKDERGVILYAYADGVFNDIELMKFTSSGVFVVPGDKKEKEKMGLEVGIDGRVVVK